MRRQVIAGNWKMNGLIGEARELCAALVEAGLGRSAPEVLVFPPYTALFAAREALEGFTEEILAHFGETDLTVNLKTKAAIAGGLVPIVCCGELLSERRDGRADAV